MDLQNVIALILIFVAAMLDVTLETLRIKFMVDGKRVMPGIMYFLEMIVWITVFCHILSEQNQAWAILAVCMGYGIGNIVSITVFDRQFAS